MDDELSPDELNELSNAMGDSDDATSEEEAGAEDILDQDASEETEELAEEEDLALDEAGAGEDDSSSGQRNISHAQFMQLEDNEGAEELPMKPIQRMYDVKVDVEVVLGSCKMPLEEILRLQSGSIVELNKLAGEPIDLIVNKKLIARAEVVVIDDNFGIKITEIIGSRHKLAQQSPLSIF